MSKSTVTLADLTQALALLGITVETPASVPAVETAPAEPKAEPLFRSKAQVAKGHEREAQIWAAHKAAAKVKRARDLTPDQMAACKAEVRAMWSALEGSCKTKRV